MWENSFNPAKGLCFAELEAVLARAFLNQGSRDDQQALVSHFGPGDGMWLDLRG